MTIGHWVSWAIVLYGLSVARHSVARALSLLGTRSQWHSGDGHSVTASKRMTYELSERSHSKNGWGGGVKNIDFLNSQFNIHASDKSAPNTDIITINI